MIKLQKSLLSLTYAQMFVFIYLFTLLFFLRYWMYLRTISRRFTQMNAYFLLKDSKGVVLCFLHVNISLDISIIRCLAKIEKQTR